MADYEKKVSLIEVEIDQTAAIAAVDKLSSAIVAQKEAVKTNNDEISNLNKTNKQLEEAVKKGELSQKDATKAINDNKQRSSELQKENMKLSDGLKNLNRDRANAVKATQLQANSLDALRAKVADQKRELNGLNTSTEEGKKRFEELTKELKKNNDQIVASDQSAGDFKTTVGRYKEELGGAIESSGGFASALGGIGDGAVSTGGKMLNLFKLIMANPIGALLTIVLGLISAFASMGDSIKFLEPIFEGVQAVIGTLMGRLGMLGGAIVKLIRGDFKGAFEDAKGAVSGLGDEIKKTFDQGVAIKNLENDIRSLSRELETVNEKLAGQADIYQKLADDATLSFEKQQQAAKNVVKIQNELFANRLKEAGKNEELLGQQIALATRQKKDTRDLLDQLASAQKEKISIENEYTAFKMDNAMLQRQLAQDVWEQDLDFAIDVGTRRTEEAQRAAENEALSLEQRKAALEKAKELDKEAAANQIALFEQVGLSKEKANQLINESNAKVIAEELKKTSLSEIERNRFRELVLERQGLLEGLAATEKSVSDAEVNEGKDRIKKQEELNEKLYQLAIFKRDRDMAMQLEQAKSDEERYQLRLEQEDERFAEDLARLEEQQAAINENTGLSEDEKAALIADSQLKIEQLKAEHHDAVLKMAEEAAKKELEIEKGKEEQRQKILTTSQQLLRQGANAYFSVKNYEASEQYNKELLDLENRHNMGLVSDQEYESKKLNINRKAKWEAYKLAFQEFVTNKILSLGQIAVDTAKGVAGALGFRPWSPLNIVTAALVGALGVAQGITVAAQRPPSSPRYAEGGNVVGGKLHAHGGTKYYGEDGNVFEVERGEGIFVTKREATNPALALLDSTNRAYGGASMFANSHRFLQSGGNVATGGGFSMQSFKEAIASMPNPVVDVRSIMGGINAEIESKEVGVI